MIHSVIGQADPDRKYETGERPIAQQEVDRIQTLQDLHAAISLAVILLVIGLFACMVFPFLGHFSDFVSGKEQTVRVLGPWERPIALILTYILYAVGTSTALTFLDIANGIFEAVESHAESLKQRIRNNISPTRGKDDEAKQ